MRTILRHLLNHKEKQQYMNINSMDQMDRAMVGWLLVETALTGFTSTSLNIFNKQRCVMLFSGVVDGEVLGPWPIPDDVMMKTQTYIHF